MWLNPYLFVQFFVASSLSFGGIICIIVLVEHISSLFPANTASDEELVRIVQQNEN